MEHLVALVAFSFVSSVTPGPNNVLLWASGTAFGFRRTIPHVIGTALGLGAMAIAAAAGLGALVTSVPEIGVAMRVAGSAYLLYLAWQIAGSHALQRGAVARPMSVLKAMVFQAINPKAWIFALGAITTFRPPDSPALVGGALVAVTMMVVILPSAGLWAFAGGALSRFVSGGRTGRIVSLVLAALLAATVVFVWI